jgi:hypothetical protein
VLYDVPESRIREVLALTIDDGGGR